MIERGDDHAVGHAEEPLDITLRPPVWWIGRDGGVRIETGDRLVVIELGRLEANDLANMIIGVHEVLGVQ